MPKNKRGKNTKKLLSLMAAAMLLLPLVPAAAFAETDVNLNAQAGRLLISEAGTYTLTGSMRGTVWVDPGAGGVTLILDNITIDGGSGAGIAAVSGDSLTVILADGTVNSVQDGGSDPIYDAAIYCAVPTRFEGSGRLDVTGNNKFGIHGQDADLTFASGSYFIRGAAGSVETSGQLSVLNASVTDLNSDQTLAAAPQMVVQTGNGGKLNLRQEPDKNSAMIEQYGNGTAVTVLDNQGEWSQVEVNGRTGYMMNQYLAPVQEQTVGSVSAAHQTASGVPAADTQAASNPPAAESQATSHLPAADTQTASNPAAPTAEMNPPQIPDQQNQAVNQGGNPPQIPSDMNGQPQNGMDGNMPSDTALTSASENPGEIVMSTAENNAASLEADLENAEYIIVSDENSQVKISDSGTYVVTGASSDGNITVKKGTTGVVLVLNDLDLTSTTGATVSVNKEAQVKIIISGNVTLTDAENPENENAADEAVADAFDGAAMKFKANSQVYITGDGVLTINGSAKNGIKTGDDASLIIDGGVTVNITAANDGINGNYDVTLLNGNFTITAGDDAIHADHILTVGNPDGTGPTIRINGSNEGLEGTVVNVFGGDISIVSTDDAINAANGDGLYEGVLDYSFNMTGGRVTIVSQGDGIDSNGSVNLMGGYASIASASMGGEAGIDYDGQMYVSDEFQLNNQSGVAGPDGMPGGMNGSMGDPFGGQNGMGQENSGQPAGDSMEMPPMGNNQPGFGPGQNSRQEPPQAPQMNQ